MKKNIFIIIGLLIIIAVSGWIIASSLILQPGGEVETTDLGNQEEVEKEVVLVINNGIQLETFTVEFKEGMTAFDLLKDKVEELNLDFKTKTYDIGILVEAIGDEENGQDGKYWLYYVNEEMPMVASDKNEIKAGDKVEFRFEKSSFSN